MPFPDVHEASIVPILEPYTMVFGWEAGAILVDPNDDGLMLTDRHVGWIVEAIALLIPEFTSWAILEYDSIEGNLSMDTLIFLEALASCAIGLSEPILLSNHCFNQRQQVPIELSNYSGIIAGPQVHSRSGINCIIIAEAGSLPWQNVTKCEVQIAIDAADWRPTAGDLFIADARVPKFDLRVHYSRLRMQIFVFGM